MSLYDWEDDSRGCFECKETQKTLDKAIYWLESVVEQLDDPEGIRSQKLNDHLQELCHVLNVTFPKRGGKLVGYKS